MADIKDELSKLNTLKAAKLSKYINSLKERQSSGQIGAKHKNRQEAYSKWLKHEIELHEKRLEALRS